MSSVSSTLATSQTLAGNPQDVLESSLRGLPIASSELIQERALQRRTDSKFAVPIAGIPELIAEISDAYHVLESDGQVLADYETLYFDDDELSSFYAHQRDLLPRFKVRIRRYKDRNLSFLEIKRELDGELREKHRWEVPNGTRTLNSSHMARLRTRESTLPLTLAPRLSTDFSRATLLSKDSEERVTVDTNLVFCNENNFYRVSRLAIIEVKQASFCEGTRIMRALARAGVHARPFSKYCTATHLLDHSKKNRDRSLIPMPDL